MTNKMILLNKKVKNHPILYLIIFIFFFIQTSLSYFIKTYDVLEVTGIIECDQNCVIKMSFPYDKVDILQYDDLKLNYLSKNYEIEDVIYSDSYLNNGVPFQDVTIVVPVCGEDRIINFRLLYNKQRIIEKIKEIVVNGE